jgi:hypothetical protein
VAGWVQLAVEVALERNAEELMVVVVVDTLGILEAVEEAAQVVVADTRALEAEVVVPACRGSRSAVRTVRRCLAGVEAVDSAVEVLKAEVLEREWVVAEALVWVDLLMQPGYYSRLEFAEEVVPAVAECAEMELVLYARSGHLLHSALLDQLYVAGSLGHRGVEVDIR